MEYVQLELPFDWGTEHIPDEQVLEAVSDAAYINSLFASAGVDKLATITGQLWMYPAEAVTTKLEEMFGRSRITYVDGVPVRVEVQS